MGDASDKDQRGVWTRSLKNMDENLLLAYENGNLADCSFKVGMEPADYKVFKCHKLILSIASSVFEAMLYGNFNEASKGPDEPINLEDTDPIVFEAAMKFIYGKKEEFDDVALAIDMYKFAHKMQIFCLESAVKDFLDDELTPSNALAIYNLFKMTGTDADFGKLEETFLEDEEAAFESPFWLEVSADTVKDVLQMDEINLNELDIFKALIKWGKAQVEFDREEDPDETRLREKVQPFLRLIRFESMQPAHAAEVCKMSKALSPEEQRAVMLAAVTEIVGDLPDEWAVLEKRPARKLTKCVKFKYTKSGQILNSAFTCTAYFMFSVTRKVNLHAVTLSRYTVIPSLDKTIILMNAESGEILGQFRHSRHLKFVEIGANRALLPGFRYSLSRNSQNETVNLDSCKPVKPDSAGLVTDVGATYFPISKMNFVLS